MHVVRAVRATVLATTMAATPVAAQTTVSLADIQSLQDNVFETGSDLSRLRTGDGMLLGQLRAELEELRDEVIYLKVKLRKREPLARTEYTSVRDRIEDVRRRARGENTVTAAGLGPGATAPKPSTARDRIDIPVRTEIEVRLLTSVNSGTAQIDDRFEAATLVDLRVNGQLAIPAGSLMRGVIVAVEPASTNRTGMMTVSFDQITVKYRTHRIRATVMQAPGIVIGDDGTIAPAKGRQIELLQGTVVRVRFDSPATIASSP